MLNGIVNKIENLPKGMIDPKNLEKAKQRRPDYVKDLIKRGKLVDEANWEKWANSSLKEEIESQTINFVACQIE